MKVFISWSGSASLGVALVLRDWLVDLLPGVQPFVSSEDLRKGRRWAADLAVELAASKFGIICLTPATFHAPWVLFEAGAISKTVEESRVCTLLLQGLAPSQITGPLADFNHTVFDKEDVRRLAEDINAASGEGARAPDSLARMYELLWASLEATVSKVLATAENEGVPAKRTSEDMLAELLELARSNAKRDGGTPPVAQRVPSGMFGAYWAKFLEQIEIFSPDLHPLLAPGQLIGIQDQGFYVSFSDEFGRSHSTKLTQPREQAALDWAASQVYGAPLRVHIVGPPLQFTASETSAKRVREILEQI